MSNLNLNKTAAALFCAGLIAMVTGKVTEFLYYGGPVEHGSHEEAKRGFKIDVVETANAAEGGAAPAGPADIKPLLASADMAAGGKIFSTKCTTCHSGDKGGANKVGPALWGVANRKVASVAGFNYSSGMKSHGDKNWNNEELNQFLYKPAKYVPGTMMSFAGIQKDQDRANLIAYLNSLK